MEICKRCKYESTCSTASESDFCLNYEPRPQTNAERIRAMTDEELAYFMANIEPCRESAWLDWLKQEATE